MRKSNRRAFTSEQCRRGGSANRGGEFAEEARLRALQDAKGETLRHGKHFTAPHPEGLPWEKRRSLHGRVDQIDLVYDGQLRRTTGETKLSGPDLWLRGQ